MKTCVLIVAAGRGERAGAGLPKQYRQLAGTPVLRRSVQAFIAHPAIAAVQVVIAAGDQERYDRAVGDLDLPPPIIGGAERQVSVRLGLEGLETQAPDCVLIHDAARPVVPPALIDRVVAALEEAPAALPVLPVVDTVRRGEAGLSLGTVPRVNLYRAQTPQGMRFSEILAAHRAAEEQDITVTDDAALMEWAGHPVRLVDGAEETMKITTTEDFRRAEADLRQALEIRVGTGFDVHRFGPGDGVTLGGVSIPHDQALTGHSDADVALHALTDAVLGAIGDGDIGSHFPPTDPQWRGAASDQFLSHAVDRVTDLGGEIRHLDLTLICERPKVGPVRDAIRERIAEICALPVARVSVKATTTERLGFTGRREGIAAQAAATVALPPPEDP